ncbi:MAG: hypothetical protein RIQ80_497 [Actinomycetota bacterium]
MKGVSELTQHLPIAKVILDIALPHLDHPFDYEIPLELDQSCQPGVKVKVKFAGRNLDGWVIERAKPTLENKKLSIIEKVISEIPVLKPEIIDVCRITADQFVGTLNDTLRFSVPPRQAKIEKKYRYNHTNSKNIKNTELSFYTKKINSVDFPPNYDYQNYLIQVLKEVKQNFRQSIIIFPDFNDVINFDDHLKKNGFSTQILSAEQEPSKRYESFLEVLTNSVDVVIGTRNAVFAPVNDLGLIVVWDDSEENYYSPQAPYWNVRQVSLTRSKLSDCFVFFAGFGKSLKTFMDIKNNLVNEVEIDSKNEFWPEINWNSSEDPIEKMKMIPSAAWKLIQEGLKSSNVLIQVPRLGYSSNLQCLECKESLRCAQCSGPLYKSDKSQSLQCKWCIKTVTFWQCQYCKSSKYVTTVSGQKKIVEEIGKSFPGVKIVTSGGKNILRKVKNENSIVVATPGAEPISEDPYSALIVIDAYLYLAKGGLSSYEDTYRKWINAISLVKKKSDSGKVYINLDTNNLIIQSFLKQTSNWYLDIELSIRNETNLYPVKDMFVATGQISEINELISEFSNIEDLTFLGPNINENSNESRVIFSTKNTANFLIHLRSLINRFSLKKRNPVRVKFNPYDID